MDKHELNDKLFDELLKFVVDKKVDESPIDVPSDEELDNNISLRPDFEKKMDQFFKKATRKERGLRIRRTLIRVGVTAMGVLVVFTAVIFSVDALRVPFLNFFNTVNQESTTIHVNDERADYSALGDQIKGLYLPTYIPDSYTVKTIDIKSSYYRIVLQDANQNSITMRKLLEGYSVGLDSESAEVESLTVNDGQAQYYVKDGINTLVFKYDTNAFMLAGIVSKDELIRIAESIKYRP